MDNNNVGAVSCGVVGTVELIMRIPLFLSPATTVTTHKSACVIVIVLLFC